MKRGHVPRRAAQAANFGLFLAIVGVCAYVAWRASQYEAFVIPEGYVAGYVESGGFLWKKDQVRTLAAGTHPVLKNEVAATSPAYRLGTQSFLFEASATVDVSFWKDAKNLLTREHAPTIHVRGEIEASVTEETVEALLVSNAPLDEAMKNAVDHVLAKSVKEDAASSQELEEALLGGLAERLAEQIRLDVERIQIDEVAKVPSITPTTVRLPADFLAQPEIVNETPPAAYTSVGLAVLIGAALFVIMRLLFADFLALLVLTPFQWIGLVDGIQWRVAEDEQTKQDKAGILEGMSAGIPTFPDAETGKPVPDGAGPSPDVPGFVEDAVGAGADAGAEMAGGTVEAAAESGAAAVEALGGAAGELASGLGEAAAGCAEGCLGGIFG